MVDYTNKLKILVTYILNSSFLKKSINYRIFYQSQQNKIILNYFLAKNKF